MADIVNKGYSFDNDDMKSSKRHVVLVSLIFLLKSVIAKNTVWNSHKLYGLCLCEEYCFQVV